MKYCVNNFLAVSTAALVTIAGPGVAGSGNNAFVIQETPLGAAEGNSLRIDQSAASDSTVAGVARTPIDPDDATNTITLSPTPEDSEFLDHSGTLINFDPDEAAMQSGNGNSASIVTLSNSTVGLFQSGNNNSGAINAGAGQVLLYQYGNGNEGTLSTQNSAALASLLQDGDGNTGAVTVSGAGTEGLLAQIGNNNSTSLEVDTSGASVSFTVNGSNTSASLPASVVSTAGGGNITIIQRPLIGQ